MYPIFVCVGGGDFIQNPMCFGFHRGVAQPSCASSAIEEGGVWRARINDVLKHQLTV